MKLSQILALGTMVLGISSMAHATTLTGTISINSQKGVYANIGPTSVTFDNTMGQMVSGTAAGIVADGTGSFSQFDMAGDSPIVNYPSTILYSSIATTAGGLQIFSFTDPSGNVFSFNATSYAPQTGNPNGVDFYGSLYENGMMVIQASEYDLTNPGASTPQSFTSSVFSATPEPNSLILLGTGLMGAAGLVMRKRRTAIV